MSAGIVRFVMGQRHTVSGQRCMGRRRRRRWGHDPWPSAGGHSGLTVSEWKLCSQRSRVPGLVARLETWSPVHTCWGSLTPGNTHVNGKRADCGRRVLMSR